MSQLTCQDIAEVVEEVVERKLDERFADFEDKIDRGLGVFVEHMNDKFDSLAEALQVMSGTMSTLARDSDLQEVKQDVRTIRHTVRATNDDLHRLEYRFEGLVQRFGRWEQAAI